MTSDVRLPMFPLGRPHFPSESVILRVFEPRYLQMMTEILAGDGRFGTVMISHGSEVGGSDRRETIGTMIELERVIEIAGGTELGVVGTGYCRIAVTTWHRDDPFPVADIDQLVDTGLASPDIVASVHSLDAHLTRLYAMAAKLGVDVTEVDRQLPADPTAAVWRLCTLAPLADLDRQRLLGINDLSNRIAGLGAAFDEVEEDLSLRLSE